MPRKNRNNLAANSHTLATLKNKQQQHYQNNHWVRYLFYTILTLFVSFAVIRLLRTSNLLPSQPLELDSYVLPSDQNTLHITDYLSNDILL